MVSTSHDPFTGLAGEAFDEEPGSNGFGKPRAPEVTSEHPAVIVDGGTRDTTQERTSSTGVSRSVPPLPDESKRRSRGSSSAGGAAPMSTKAAAQRALRRDVEWGRSRKAEEERRSWLDETACRSGAVEFLAARLALRPEVESGLVEVESGGSETEADRGRSGSASTEAGSSPGLHASSRQPVVGSALSVEVSQDLTPSSAQASPGGGADESTVDTAGSLLSVEAEQELAYWAGEASAPPREGREPDEPTADDRSVDTDRPVSTLDREAEWRARGKDAEKAGRDVARRKARAKRTAAEREAARQAWRRRQAASRRSDAWEARRESQAEIHPARGRRRELRSTIEFWATAENGLSRRAAGALVVLAFVALLGIVAFFSDQVSLNGSADASGGPAVGDAPVEPDPVVEGLLDAMFSEVFANVFSDVIGREIIGPETIDESEDDEFGVADPDDSSNDEPREDASTTTTIEASTTSTTEEEVIEVEDLPDDEEDGSIPGDDAPDEEAPKEEEESPPSPVRGVNLLESGDFESPVLSSGSEFVPSIPGWQLARDAELWRDGRYGFSAWSGNQFLELNGVGPDTISQPVAVSPGDYLFSVAHQAVTDADTIELLVNGLPVARFTHELGSWHVASTTVTVPEGETSIVISVRAVDEDVRGNLIDDVVFQRL